jgi:hypothetical protein
MKPDHRKQGQCVSAGLDAWLHECSFVSLIVIFSFAYS